MVEKETFQTAIDQEFEKWNSQIEEHVKNIEGLKKKAEQLELDAKLQYLEQIKDLENKIEHLKSKLYEGQERLNQLKGAGEEAWEEVKTGSQNAWGDLAGGINTAWEEVKTSFDLASSKLKDRMPKK